MDRNFVFLMLVALIAPVLAGCTAQAMPYSSAEEVRPPADEASHRWSKDAQLVAIVGLEGQWAGHDYSHSGSFQAAQEDAAAADDRTDGRTELWVFRYVSSSKDLAYNVAVDQHGRIIAEEEDRRDDDDVPVGAFRVDSDEAVRVAYRSSDELEASQKAASHGGMVALGRDDDYANPVWVVMGMAYSDEGMQGGMVIIDAVTGKVLASMPFGNWGSYDQSWSGGTYPGCGPYC